MAGSPKVSVVIPSFNGKDLLNDCLQSLRTQTFPSDQFEIIVVDNGSIDGTSDWLRTHHSDVRIIRQEANSGFAAGTNRGAASARGEWLVFVNNDTAAAPRFIEELVRVAIETGVACVAGRILDWDGAQVEFGGAGLTIFGFGSQHSSSQLDFTESRQGEALPFACGGAMLIRRSVFAELGGFDADYFAYYEDVDLGWRLWSSGHRIIYAALAEVRHHRHATGKRLADRQQHFLWYRNGLTTLFKNADDGWIRQILPYAFAASFHRISRLQKLAALERSGGDSTKAEHLFETAAGASEGVNWVFENIEELRQKRTQVQAGRRVSDRSLANQFGISIDFGAEISGSENAFALQLLPLLDLAGLLTPEQVASAAVESAARVGREASETENLRFKTIALGRELDARNHEVARLHRDLHERNLSIQTTETSLHEKNLEIERLHRDLHNRNVQLGSTESRLNDVLSSRSWRWTAPLRALFRKSSRSH